MPFEKNGPCPFTGAHRPPQWGQENITNKSVSGLHCDQKKDLIEYFYEQNSAKTPAKSKPAYRFPLNQLRTLGLMSKF
jgi:hypothetical protein